MFTYSFGLVSLFAFSTGQYCLLGDKHWFGEGGDLKKKTLDATVVCSFLKFTPIQQNLIPYYLILWGRVQGMTIKEKKKKFRRAPERGDNEKSEKHWYSAMGCWDLEGKCLCENCTIKCMKGTHG